MIEFPLSLIKSLKCISSQEMKALLCVLDFQSKYRKRRVIEKKKRSLKLTEIPVKFQMDKSKLMNWVFMKDGKGSHLKGNYSKLNKILIELQVKLGLEYKCVGTKKMEFKTPKEFIKGSWMYLDYKNFNLLSYRTHFSLDRSITTTILKIAHAVHSEGFRFKRSEVLVHSIMQLDGLKENRQVRKVKEKESKIIGFLIEQEFLLKRPVVETSSNNQMMWVFKANKKMFYRKRRKRRKSNE